MNLLDMPGPAYKIRMQEKQLEERESTKRMMTIIVILCQEKPCGDMRKTEFCWPSKDWLDTNLS